MKLAIQTDYFVLFYPNIFIFLCCTVTIITDRGMVLTWYFIYYGGHLTHYMVYSTTFFSCNQILYVHFTCLNSCMILHHHFHNGIFLIIDHFSFASLQFRIICLKSALQWEVKTIKIRCMLVRVISSELPEDSLCVWLRLRHWMTARGYLIMVPILKLPHQHQSGSYLEELHDLRLGRPPWIKPFITRWHPCPALNVCTPWERDETSETWWVTDNLRKGRPAACRLRAAASARPAVPSQPCQLFRLADATLSAQPTDPGPFHLRWQTAGRREIAGSRWGHLLWLAQLSIVSLSHVTYSCFLVWQHF